MASAFSCVLDVKASLGECPVWSIDAQALYWVDINAPSLNRFDPARGINSVWPMPQSIGCFALRSRGGFVAALRDGIWFVVVKAGSNARSPPRRTIRRITASMTAAPMDRAASGQEA
jgi:sugar lactone lactonase YvrE